MQKTAKKSVRLRTDIPAAAWPPVSLDRVSAEAVQTWIDCVG